MEAWCRIWGLLAAVPLLGRLARPRYLTAATAVACDLVNEPRRDAESSLWAAGFSPAAGGDDAGLRPGRYRLTAGRGAEAPVFRVELALYADVTVAAGWGVVPGPAAA